MNSMNNYCSKWEDYNGSWKVALEYYFYECLQLLAPNIYTEIDTNIKPEFLDKELQNIFSKAKYGRRMLTNW